MDRLTRFYGRDALIRGAAISLTEGGSFSARYSWYGNWTKKHPHTRERLRALGMSEEFSEKEGKNLLLTLKEMIRNLAAYCCLELQDESSIMVKYLMNTDMRIGALLTSVHSNVANRYAKKIHQLSLVQVFSDILAYLKQEIGEPDCLTHFSEDDRLFFKKLRLKETSKIVIEVFEEFVENVLKDSVAVALDYLDVSDQESRQEIQ